MLNKGVNDTFVIKNVVCLVTTLDALFSCAKQLLRHKLSKCQEKCDVLNSMESKKDSVTQLSFHKAEQSEI